MKRVFAFVGFSVAITLFVLNTVDYSLIKYILLSAAALLIASLLIKNLRQERVAPITFGAILFACLIFIIVMNTRVAPQKALDGQTANSEFQIIDIETKTDGGYLYTVKTSAIDLPNAPQNIKLKVKTDSKITADYYDNISGVLAFYSYTDSGFQSYGDYGDDVFVRAGLIDYEVKPNDSKPPNYYIIELRLKIKDILNKNLDEENAGLALSIFTGDKRLLYDDIDNSFKACGISHMTAVSGLHISVICLCIYYLLKFFKTPKIPQTIITLAVLLIYSGVADYSKSVLRAGIMITVMLLARLVNNKADTLNSLGFAVFIICLNPFAVTDASAVLTVTAVLGLSVVKPAYDRLFRSKNKIFRYFYDGLLIGICVLLTTLPAMWLFFGRISLMSLLLNIIGIPLLELALVSVLLLCIFSGVPFLAFVPKCLSSFSLGALIKIADFSKEHFDFLYLNISDSLFGISIAGVLLILAASLLANYKINVKAISVLLAAAFAVTTVLSI
ncbi:MAG: ComEC/Rec2 family competence protein, partial [Eubacterium sp.]